MGDQQVIPAQKTPKLIFVLFFLFFLVVAAEGAYYLYLRRSGEAPGLLTGIWKKKETGETTEVVSECGSSENPCPSPDPNINRYFDGVDFYEEINGKKHLLVSEGIVEKIEGKTVVLKKGNATKGIRHTNDDIIYLFNPADPPDLSRKISFLDIAIGDFVAYAPIDDSIGVNREQAVWSVRKQ